MKERERVRKPASLAVGQWWCMCRSYFISTTNKQKQSQGEELPVTVWRHLWQWHRGFPGLWWRRRTLKPLWSPPHRAAAPTDELAPVTTKQTTQLFGFTFISFFPGLGLIAPLQRLSSVVQQNWRKDTTVRVKNNCLAGGCSGVGCFVCQQQSSIVKGTQDYFSCTDIWP